MAQLVSAPFVVPAAGSPPKLIEEFFGRVATGAGGVSIARMRSPPGWAEPGQTPEFDEYTTVLGGTLRVETRSGTLEVRAGQAVYAPRGDWVRYSTPEGAEYVAVCIPAFSLDLVHRDG
jgi:quercetin dioxygenase-like cupin family protein